MASVKLEGLAGALRGLLADLEILAPSPRPELLRGEALRPVAEVPAPLVLPLGDLLRWRRLLGAAAGLETLLFVAGPNGLQPLGNNAFAVPALAGCDRSCLIEAAARCAVPEVADRSAGWNCASCGGEVWTVPLRLEHAGRSAVLGALLGHDLPAPAAPWRQLLELLAQQASRNASASYALQAVLADGLRLARLARPPLA